MMQDQHKSVIQDFYEQSVNKAKRYLESKYPLEPCDDDDGDYPKNIKSDSWIAWKIKVESHLRPLTYIIAIPRTFPDNLPKIYLSKKDYSDIGPIPHIDKDRFVCTRDPGIVFINEEKPGEAVNQLIKIATEEIINKGLKKENTADFIEEFLAYWNEEAKWKVLSLVPPSESIKKLKLIEFSAQFLDSKHVIANSEGAADKWLSPFKIDINKKSVYDCLYLPLANPIPLPRKKNDYYKIIQEAGKKALPEVKSYFKQRDSNLFIVFSFPLQKERILAGWKQTNPPKVNGFRKGKIPLNVKMQRCAIEKMKIERIDKERLFKRGGTGIRQRVAGKAIAIIGCGSLGSTLAISLSKTGISKFLLVDNECVELENVARHECGFSEAGYGERKSLAVKTRLTRHFPHIECSAYCDDILELLSKEDSLLNSYDLVIIATGNRPVERRLNFLLRKKVITSPVLFVWLEPFGVAGQILYVHPNNDGCYQCCLDKNGEFIYSVAKPNTELYKREAGCQSTFIQYSSLDIEHFAAIAGRKTMSFLEYIPESSTLYTWLGDLSRFKSLGYEIRNEWFADASYSTHKQMISRNENCKICRNN